MKKLKITLRLSDAQVAAVSEALFEYAAGFEYQNDLGRQCGSSSRLIRSLEAAAKVFDKAATQAAQRCHERKLERARKAILTRPADRPPRR